jgi:hypothetical protein
MATYYPQDEREERMSGAHSHQYSQDTRPDRAAFVVCQTCGFCVPKSAILSYWMVLDRQLSPGLLAERNAKCPRT